MGADRPMAADGAARSAAVRWWNPLATVRLIHGLLWIMVAAAPIAAIVTLAELATLRGQMEAAAAPVEVPADTSQAEGLAEISVADFLTGGGAARTGSGDAASWRVVGTVSLGAEEVAPGYYAVTVAADATVETAATSETGRDTVPTSRRLVFSIGVAETGTGWVTIGLPSLIATPAVTPLPDSVSRRSDGLDASPGLEDTVSRFLAALLAGDGELARYTAPGVVIQPVTPAPFLEVTVVEAGSTVLSDGSRRVTAVVEGVDAADRSMVLGYTLVVEERDGRWEVTALLAAPPHPESMGSDVSSGGGSS